MRTGRPSSPIELSDEDREFLKRLVAHPRAENREVRRARVLLLAAEGLPTREVVKRVGMTSQTVAKVKRRYRELGIASVSDLPRSGRPRTITDEKVAEVVELTLESRPQGATHWSTRSLAKKTGLSQTAVSRIWRAFQLKPHRQETFELSNDPYFVEKVRDVVGLYLDPPDKAVVLSVDEKTQVQALERTQTVLPLGPGKPKAYSPKYRRHGTTDLFAALNVATGEVLSTCRPEHKSKDFIAFLRLIDDHIDDDLDIHVIVDNHSIHKSAETLGWLMRHPRFHLHFTPTYASWLNQVEALFSVLTHRQLKQGVHRSVDELIAAIEEFIDAHNEDPKPFRWTRTADQILDSVARFCGSVLHRHKDT